MSFTETAKPVAQPYKYNGKELDNMNGLNWYDYGARHYDPTIGRFTTMDPLAEKYYSISPYAYCANNPMRYIDPTGMEWEITGDEEARKAYLEMLHNSTGNNYSINENNRLVLAGADDNFKGQKSDALIHTIQTGIDSKEVYSLSLVGAKGDDHSVFIDSYENKQIDVSDLTTLGKASTALQGAAIGHFLNEVQVGGEFVDAHAPSLKVEGKIYGELIEKKTIKTKTEIPSFTPPVDGYETFTWKYDSKNQFLLTQGATAVTKPIGTIGSWIYIIRTGELKSVRKK
jgi:RHS repeat-associated protein